MRSRSYLTLALFTFSCRGPSARVDQQQVASTLSASASASAPASTSGFRTTDQVESAGLRVRSGVIEHGTLWGVSELTLDPARTRLSIAQASHGAALASLLPAQALAIVNGGYFEADFRPSAWLVDAGRELSPRADATKGGVLALGHQIYLGPLAGLTFAPELAVQSFPLIVEVDGSSGIHRDDGRRAARTIACLVAGQLHLIVIAAPRGEGPTLFETSALLRAPAPAGFGCEVALNLDGGPSSGVWFGPTVSAKQRPPAAPVAYGIAISPR